MRFRIEIKSGGRAGQEVMVDGKVVRIGRDPSSDVALDPEQDSQASTNHAQIMLMDNGEVLLSDLGSSNGTFVGGQKVTAPMPIGPGTSVILGDGGPELVVHLEPDAPPAEEPPAEEPKKKSNTGCIIAILVFVALGFCLVVALAGGAFVVSSSDEPVPASPDAGVPAPVEPGGN